MRLLAAAACAVLGAAAGEEAVLGILLPRGIGLIQTEYLKMDSERKLGVSGVGPFALSRQGLGCSHEDWGFRGV